MECPEMILLIRHLLTGAALLLGIQLLALPTVPFAAEPAPARSHLAPSAEQGANAPNEASVLLRYTRILGGVRAGQQSPSLTLFDDGHLRVFYPDYMKQAGTYLTQLSQDELDQLWQRLTDPALLEFDINQIRQRMASSGADNTRSSEIRSVSDGSTIRLELYPNRHPAAPSLRPDNPDDSKTISWHGLQNDAERYPEIVEIQQLLAIHQQLEAFMRHTDLIKIDGAQ